MRTLGPSCVDRINATGDISRGFKSTDEEATRECGTCRAVSLIWSVGVRRGLEGEIKWYKCPENCVRIVVVVEAFVCGSAGCAIEETN